MARYAIVIELAENNFSVYVPDLPGCVAVGDTVDEVKQAIAEAIEFHVEGLVQNGLFIPDPTTVCDYAEV